MKESICIDDGYSGLIFEERPAFLRMWKDILNHRINMVIVKDLSRFGREHIKMDTYIRKIFPSLGVRFVAVADSYDSLSTKEGEQNLLIPIKNFINDSYARDISVKIRSSQEAMRREGICVGAYVPYGYQKRQGQLYPERESAVVVKLIFLLKLEGESAEEIAKKLNQWGISSPTEFRREKGSAYYTGFQEREVTQWMGGSVDRILKDRVYTGVLEQGKRMRISYKVQTVVSVPKEKWSVTKDAHLAIISEREYNLVQQISLLDIRRAPKQKEVYLFSGFLFCSDCKRIMTRRSGRSRKKKAGYYICSSYNKGEGCTRHAISEEILVPMVWLVIQAQSQLKWFLCQSERIKKTQSIGGGQTIWDGFVRKNLEKIEKYKQRIKEVEEDFYKGIINQKEYMQYQSVYGREQEKLEYAVQLCKQEKEKRKEQMQEKWMSNRLFYILLIERIEIDQKKKIKIWFRFQIDI